MLLVRFSWALLATLMLALDTDLFSTEVSLASMAGAVHSLTNWMPFKVRSPTSIRDSESSTKFPLSSSNGLDFALLSPFVLVVLLDMVRKARAPLAPPVPAVNTDLVGAKWNVTFVAGAMDTHSDFLVHALRVRHRCRELQMRRCEVQSMLLE